MRRPQSSILVRALLAASFALVAGPACSKPSSEAGSEGGPPPAASSTATAPGSASAAAPGAGSGAAAGLPAAAEAGLLAPPSGADWEEVKVSNAKLKARIPTGASIPSDRASHDKAFVGSSFRVVMPSGYDVYFAERHTDAGADVAAERLAAKKRPNAKVLFESDDAVVMERAEDQPVGKHCETTACGAVAGRPICAIAVGGRTEGTQVETLTETECLAVVTIARSIRAL